MQQNLFILANHDRLLKKTGKEKYTCAGNATMAHAGF